MTSWTEMTNPVAFDATLVKGKARKAAEEAASTLFPDYLPEAQRRPAQAQMPGQGDMLDLLDQEAP